ncbi:DUF1648 domain-containing protein [Clostridium sp. OS1-26]|uniref:DUF1648 domain-containing protein n=1 Tax=Clostridium sp. OS1-26 TaxID=3070681 RepID=UPI0027E1C944|nr:DUF1648 domain-containing protein [Clostridium sp. OS1-26]WML37157.1 DUF1648 domain-containing protein [Clostridium sp. OS1-26]
MSDKVMALITTVPIVIIMLIMQIITPKLTRRDIYFGVRVPAEEVAREELTSIYKEYIKNNLVISVIYILVFSVLVYTSEKFWVIIPILGICLYLIISFLIYYRSNKKVKEIKDKSGWYKTKKSATVIDTNFTKDKRKSVLVSPWWFIIPGIIIIVNIIIGINVYDRLPDLIPTHWNALGQVDGWTKKSYKAMLQMPFIQFFMTLVLFFSYKIIGWSKQQINASNPEESRERNIIFRRRWSGYMVIMVILINLLFTYTNLNILQVINTSGKGMMAVIISFTGLVLILSIYMSLTTGQGGSRIKLKRETNTPSDLVDRDDDKYWKLGNSIYVNKDDPSLFVEKRFGIGWTMNYGRIESIIITIVLLVLIIAMPLFFR